MKTVTRNLLSAICVFLLSLLPAVVNGDSLADRRSDTPIETWDHQELEMMRDILTEQMEPTAAGPMLPGESASGMMPSAKGMGHREMEHGMKQYKNAHHYKTEVFGND